LVILNVLGTDPGLWGRADYCDGRRAAGSGFGMAVGCMKLHIGRGAAGLAYRHCAPPEALELSDPWL
jgi:hypothetical protein